MDTAAYAIILIFVIILAAVLAKRLLASGSYIKVEAEVVGHDQTLFTRLPSVVQGTFTFFNFAAIYTFRYEGKDYRVTDSMSREKADPPVGTKVELAFPPGAPQKAQPQRRWFYAVFIVFLAVVAVGILNQLLTQ